jgi:hypothetical protein
LSLFGTTVLMCWFASILRASLRTLLTADVSPYFRDYARCPKRDSSANGAFSCMVKVRRLRAARVRYERATARFNRLTGACSAERVRSKRSRGREHSTRVSLSRRANLEGAMFRFSGARGGTTSFRCRCRVSVCRACIRSAPPSCPRDASQVLLYEGRRRSP